MEHREKNTSHLSVLTDEVIGFLDPRPGNIIVDATVGGGGHALEILRKITPGGKLIGVDRDPDNLKRADKALEKYRGNIRLVNGDFRDIGKMLSDLRISAVDGALFDLGVSSFHLDEPGRGFSFRSEGPLDMRFDRSGGITAADVVNTAGREELEGIIREYGEERYSRTIARAICHSRKKEKINTTAELAEIIRGAVGARYVRQRLHPAARTFQALRIYVNDELSAAARGIEEAVNRLAPDGVVCVISFHSLEDRIVKRLFRSRASGGELEIMTKKPVRPGCAEKEKNPRSRSARLRAARKKAVR